MEGEGGGEGGLRMGKGLGEGGVSFFLLNETRNENTPATHSEPALYSLA